MFAYGPSDLDPTIRTYPDLDLISRVKFGSGGSGHLGARSGGGRSPATMFRGGAAGNSTEFVESGVLGLVLACGLAWEVVHITHNPLGG